jgi:cyanophycinase
MSLNDESFVSRPTDRAASNFISGVVSAVAFALALAGVPLLSYGSDVLQPHDYRTPDFDYFVAGDPCKPRLDHTLPLVALMGGGGSVDSAFEALAKHSGAGHIVILRAQSDATFDPEGNDYGELFSKRWGPVASAETLIFHDRDASFDPRVAAVLAHADGIFIAGGDQSNYIRYWRDSPVQRALNAHVRAGRPIGGSSAGLAVLGAFVYGAMDGGSLESHVALKDPLGPAVTLERDFLHVPGLEHVITDTHFSRRARLGRLIVFVARLEHESPHQPVIGLGVDERTALMLDGEGTAHLAAGSEGSAWLVIPKHAPGVIGRNSPLTFRDLRIVRLDSGSRLTLPSLRMQGPLEEAPVSMVDGALLPASFATPILERATVPAGED